MALVIPEGFGTVIHSLRWAGDPEPMAITYGVASSTAGAADVDDFANALAQAFVDNLAAPLNSLLSLVQTELRFQADAPPADPILAVSSITVTGASVGSVLPQNSAFLAHKRTATGGRGGRGRFYIPGVEESVVDNLGTITGAEVTQWNTALANFLTDVTAAAPGGGGMVILHDSLGAYAASVPYLVTSMNLDPVISTQRRRLRR